MQFIHGMKRFRLCIRMYSRWCVMDISRKEVQSAYFVVHQETRAIRTNESALTQELHVIRAHLLHYTSLLEDFRKSVLFIKDTPNPATDPEVAASEKELLSRECDTLLSEIARLEMVRGMQNKRLKNVMNLVSVWLIRVFLAVADVRRRCSRRSILSTASMPRL